MDQSFYFKKRVKKRDKKTECLMSQVFHHIIRGVGSSAVRCCTQPPANRSGGPTTDVSRQIRHYVFSRFAKEKLLWPKMVCKQSFWNWLLTKPAARSNTKRPRFPFLFIFYFIENKWKVKPTSGRAGHWPRSPVPLKSASLFAVAFRRLSIFDPFWIFFNFVNLFGI